MKKNIILGIVTIVSNAIAYIINPILIVGVFLICFVVFIMINAFE